MAEINWGIINNTPNIFAMGLEGYQAGQQAGQQRQRQALVERQAQREEDQYQAGLAATARRREALATYATDPNAGRQQALQAGDFDLVEQITKLDTSQRELAAKNNADVAAFAANLKATPVAERKTVLADPRNIEFLSTRGFKPEQIAGFDPTDAALDSVIAQGMKVSEILGQQNADRDFGLRKSDTEHDNNLADQQFGETRRHNQVGERNDATRLGYEGQRVGLDRQRLGLEGQRVEIERGKAARAAEGKALPAPIQTGYLGNQKSIKQIDEAIAAIKAYPQAVGLVRGAGDGVNQRVDPRGVDARAKLANIGSLIIHDRAGASQTVNETKRLTPFVPGVTDGARAAIKKLETLRSQYTNENAGIEVAYGEGSGYRALPRAAQPSQASDGPVRVNSPAEARALPPGTRFVTPDGQEKVR